MANPAVGLGYKSYWQFGRETVYGTGVAATHKLDLMEADVKLVPNIVRDESMWGGLQRQIIYQAGYRYAGKIKVRCQYEGLAMLLDWVMGSASYGGAGGIDSGAVNGIYTHAFLLKQYLNSYTVELIEADMPAGKCFKLVGAACLGMTISGGSDDGSELLTVELDVVAQDKTSNATPTAALKTPEISLGAYTPIFAMQAIAAVMADGSGDTATDLRVKNFSLSIANAAAIRRYMGSAGKIDQPVRNAFPDFKLKIGQEFTSKALFDVAKAFTTGTLNLALADTRSPGVRSFQITGSLWKLIDYSPPVNKYGIIESTGDWETYGDTTNSPQINLGNTLATVSTAYA